MSKAKVISLEYIAGFFDGEGSIGIYQSGQKAWHLRTQLTQNICLESTALLDDVRELFGGNLATMRSPIYLRGAAYNWQINGTLAEKFLRSVLPHLRLKTPQARIAIAWQQRHPGPVREPNGRMKRHVHDPIDEKTSLLMKLLKRNSFENLVDDFADVLAALEPFLQKIPGRLSASTSGLLREEAK